MRGHKYHQHVVTPKDEKIRSLSGRAQFYIQQQATGKNGIDIFQDNEEKAIRQASKAPAQLISEHQDYLLQTENMEDLIKADSTGYQELRRSV